MFFVVVVLTLIYSHFNLLITSLFLIYKRLIFKYRQAFFSYPNQEIIRKYLLYCAGVHCVTVQWENLLSTKCLLFPNLYSMPQI